MHTRRLATFILGAWVAGTFFMMAVAIWNLDGVDRLLEAPNPSASQHIKVLGADSARMLLRHQVSELSRFYFENWEYAQLMLGIALLLTLLFATNGEKWYMLLCGLLLLLVIVERFLVTPQIISLGRAIDFVPEQTPSVERIKFWRFHNAYVALELIKLAVLGGTTLRLLTMSRRPRSRKKVDLIDDADNG